MSPNEFHSLIEFQEDDTLMNLVPIIMGNQELNLENAVEIIVSRLYSGIESFNHAAETLRLTTAKHFGADAVSELSRLTEAYQTIATGVFGWTLQSLRYGIAECRTGQGGYSISL